MKKAIYIIIFMLSTIVFYYFIFISNNKINNKNEYDVFALQAASFDNIDNASIYKANLPSSIIVKQNNLYNVYVGMYKDIDLVNKMIVYFEDNNINIYLKNIKVNKDLYNKLDNYEKILINSNDVRVYKNINQSILDMYINGESIWLNI